MKPLRIYTGVWGEKHVEWFAKGLVRSLSWPLNKNAIAHAKWSILTKPEHVKTIHDIACTVLSPERIDIFTAPTGTEDRNLALYGVVDMIQQCLHEKSQMLMALPDFIFSEGTIQTLLDMGDQPGVCVGFPHVRILPSFLTKTDMYSPLNGHYMVSKAWYHLHSSWENAQVGGATSNSFSGGVSWRALENGLIAVQHRLPSTFLVNFIPSDLDFFTKPIGTNPPSFDSWDHTWPGFALLPKQRQRIIGSSDAAFMVELTDENMNVPAIGPVNETEPDAFKRELLHNIMNRQYVSIFRGDNFV